MSVATAARPTLAVWKFASCDGCQLSLLDLEPELLALRERRAHRPLHRDDARPRRGTLRRLAGRGLITTEEDVERIKSVRAFALPRDDRRVRRDGRDSSAAQLRRARALRRDGLRPPRVPGFTRHLDPRRRRTWRSTTSCTAARSTATSCSKSSSPSSPTAAPSLRTLGMPGVQGPRAPSAWLVHGPGALSRPGDAGGLRRPVPLARAGLLWLLWARARAPTPTRSSTGCAAGAFADDRADATAPDLQRRRRRRFATARPTRRPRSTLASPASLREGDTGDARHQTNRTVSAEGVARVEGEGSLRVVVQRRTRQRRLARYLRATALLRGDARGPALQRSPRHHGEDLWNLSGRLPDVGVPGDGRRLAASNVSDAWRRCADCCTAVSGSRATRCTSTCCTRPDFLGCQDAVELAERDPGGH